MSKCHYQSAWGKALVGDQQPGTPEQEPAAETHTQTRAEVHTPQATPERSLARKKKVSEGKSKLIVPLMW